VTDTRGTRRPPVLLWTALVATLLALTLPLVGTTDGSVTLTGRELTVRVLLVGALVLIALAAAPTSSSRGRARHLVTAAVVLVGFTAALLIRFLTPTGTVLLTVAIACLLWQRRALAQR
jgi:hypothetical protein